jgi:hypothetical protein
MMTIDASSGAAGIPDEEAEEANAKTMGARDCGGGMRVVPAGNRRGNLIKLSLLSTILAVF